MRTLLLLAFVVILAVANIHGADNYDIEVLTSETATGTPPFSITRIEEQRGELRLYIHSDGTFNIAQIQKLLIDGTLSAQFSDGDNAMTVPLSLSKTVICETGEVHHLGYSVSMPNCMISQTLYYLRAPVTLAAGQGLAVGLDPDFIWAIERK